MLFATFRVCNALPQFARLTGKDPVKELVLQSNVLMSLQESP
jgi:hypothetical protein